MGYPAVYSVREGQRRGRGNARRLSE